MSKPKSTADRQRAYRARKAAEGLQLVQGLYARPEHHERIKKYAAKLERAAAQEQEKPE